MEAQVIRHSIEKRKFLISQNIFQTLGGGMGCILVMLSLFCPGGDTSAASPIKIEELALKRINVFQVVIP